MGLHDRVLGTQTRTRRYTRRGMMWLTVARARLTLYYMVLYSVTRSPKSKMSWQKSSDSKAAPHTDAAVPFIWAKKALAEQSQRQSRSKVYATFSCNIAQAPPQSMQHKMTALPSQSPRALAPIPFTFQPHSPLPASSCGGSSSLEKG